MDDVLYEVFVNNVSVYKSYDWVYTQRFLSLNYASWFCEQINSRFTKITTY